MSSDKNGKNASSSSSNSRNPEEQQSPERVQHAPSPTQQATSHRMPHTTPHPHPPSTYPSQIQGDRDGSSSGGFLGGSIRGGMQQHLGMQAIDVVGVTGSSVGVALDDIVDRKRAREENEGLAAAGGDRGGEFVCWVCGRWFRSDKSLFGHLRVHSGTRNWKGAFPPPTFSRTEFADTNLLNPERGEEDIGDNVAQAEVNEQPQVQYRTPNLNLPPSEEDNKSGDSKKDN